MKPNKPFNKVTIAKAPAEKGTIPVAISEEEVEKYNGIFNHLGKQFVERSEELEAIKFCVITASHILLKGLHGTAKSRLADAIFKHFPDSKTFKAFFMKNTQPDQIFGPMISKIYREQGLCRHNVTGMLPTAHFFFGDEIYRASEHFLPSIMNILNEREFLNGEEHYKCPLITAIGTTNFTTDTEELAAFNDRWHVICEVQPLTALDSVVEMLSAYNANEQIPVGTTMTLAELARLQQGVTRVKVSEEMLRLYAETIHAFAKGSSNKYISDRRKCAGLNFIKASALLSGRREVNEDDIHAARYVCFPLRVSAHENQWGTVTTGIIGQYKLSVAESVELTTLAKYADKLQAKFDPEMDDKSARELFKEVRQAIGSINSRPADRNPKTPRAIDMDTRTIKKLRELEATLKDKVSV